MSNGNSFTPTQRRILDVLSDGKPHLRSELASCLNDDLAVPKTLRSHLTALRMKLRPIGCNIVCEIRDNCVYYKHTRMIDTSE